MRHIVQTAIERHAIDKNDRSSLHLTDKVTIGCQSAKEACDIADTLQFIPNRRVFAGVELYTEGGVKIVLSYRDIHDIARLTRDIPGKAYGLGPIEEQEEQELAAE